MVLIKQKKYLWQAKILPKGSLSLRFDTGHLLSEHIIDKKMDLSFLAQALKTRKNDHL